MNNSLDCEVRSQFLNHRFTAENLEHTRELLAKDAAEQGPELSPARALTIGIHNLNQRDYADNIRNGENNLNIMKLV